MFLNFKKNNIGFTLIELVIAIAIGFIIVGAAISYFLFSMHTTANVRQSANINEDVVVSFYVMEKRLMIANAFYLTEEIPVLVTGEQRFNAMYMRYYTDVHSEEWICFYFEPSGSVDSDGHPLPGTLYEIKHSVSGWSNPRVVSDQLANVIFSFPDPQFNNILRVTIKYMREHTQLSQSVLIRALHMSNKNMVEFAGQIIPPQLRP